ncbi:MAG: gfo/Idh/MocA family oxidoreductase [Candidatus Omnitrophota bacterium]|jgi:predicted dehydrogenase|nr:MAG: gfo/Idh/MocA family oxidoreductase [Candidatus Omnitrophota bacterium]
MKRLKAAVIGCGAIAHNCHLPGFQKNKWCDLIAVADPSTENLKKAHEKFKIEKAYTDPLEMLETERPDAVTVCSPNKYHAEQAIAALNLGCHVLCEKPLCVSMKEANAIKKAADKAGTIFMVAFSNRLYKGNIVAKKALDAGKIGEPFMIRIRFAHEGPSPGWAMSDWFYNPEKAHGGALFDMGIHAIDLAAYYFGKITHINAMVGTLAKKIAMEDNAILQFRFASGKLGYAEVGWTSKQGFAGVEINGSDGALVVDYSDSVQLVTGSTNPSGKRVIRKKVIEKNPTAGGWPIEIDHFVDAIRKNKQPEMGLQAGIDSLRVALGAYDSDKKGKTIVVG